MLFFPKNNIIKEKNLYLDCSEIAFRHETKTSGSWSFEIENSRILEFWDRQLQDPGVFEKCFIKNDDFTSQQSSYTKTKFATETDMLCYLQNDIIVKIFYLLIVQRQHFEIRQKLQDPGVFRLKTLGSWSFEIENSMVLEFLKNTSSKMIIARRNKHPIQKQSSRSKQACFVIPKTIL